MPLAGSSIPPGFSDYERPQRRLKRGADVIRDLEAPVAHARVKSISWRRLASRAIATLARPTHAERLASHGAPRYRALLHVPSRTRSLLPALRHRTRHARRP